MSGIVNGSAIMLYIGGLPVFCGKTNEESAKRDVIETTNKFTGGNFTGIYGKFSATGSAEGLFAETPVNLLLYNATLANAAWTKTGCTVADKQSADQDSKILASTVSGWNSTDSLTQSVSGINGTARAMTYSVWLKGTGTVTLKISDGAGNQTSVVTLTSTLTRYSVSFTSAGDASAVVAGFVRGADTATGWTMASAMLNIGSTYVDYQPSASGYSALFTALKDKTQVAIVTGSYESGSDIYSGTALITDLKRTEPVEDVVTYSISYQITGELTPTTI